jgi:ABC-type multidrug transport system fused ATPase/permease subunit
MSLPRQYETVFDGLGRALSDREKQGITIARTIWKDA